MNWLIHSFDTLDSTQNWLKKRWQLEPAGTVIVAAQQKQGQGRHKRIWSSEPGGLYFSFLLKPKLLQPRLPWLLWAASVQVLESYTPTTVQLKAPNDILYQNRKISGNLIDAAIQGVQPQYYICGLGLNLNQTRFEPHLNAISLAQICQHQFGLTDILEHWLHAFTELYQSSANTQQKHLAHLFGGRQVQIGYNNPKYINYEEYWHVTGG